MPDQLLGRREDRVPPEAVDLAEVARAGDVAARLGDQRGEVLALVAQRVVLGGGDQRRRQRAEPVREERRQVGVGQVRVRARRTAASTTAPRAGRRPRPRRARRTRSRPAGPGTGSAAPPRGTARDAAGRPPARGCRRRCRRGRTSARPGSGSAPPWSSQREHGVDVVGRGREPVLGRQSVVDAQHRHAEPVREPPARPVVHRRRRGRRSRHRAGAPARPGRHPPAGTAGPGTPSASRSTTSATSSGGSWSANARLASRAAATS